MTTTQRASGATDTGLPAVLTQEQWDMLHDALTLALDALGDGPADVDSLYLGNSMMFQRQALGATHHRMRSLGGDC